MKKEIITKDIRKQGKADIGVALGALVGNVLGRQDCMAIWHAEVEQDGHPVGSAVGDSDGKQLGHCDVRIMLGALSATRLESTSVLRWAHSSVK